MAIVIDIHTCNHHQFMSSFFIRMNCTKNKTECDPISERYSGLLQNAWTFLSGERSKLNCSCSRFTWNVNLLVLLRQNKGFKKGTRKLFRLLNILFSHQKFKTKKNKTKTLIHTQFSMNNTNNTNNTKQFVEWFFRICFYYHFQTDQDYRKVMSPKIGRPHPKQ